MTTDFGIDVEAFAAKSPTYINLLWVLEVDAAGCGTIFTVEHEPQRSPFWTHGEIVVSGTQADVIGMVCVTRMHNAQVQLAARLEAE